MALGVGAVSGGGRGRERALRAVEEQLRLARAELVGVRARLREVEAHSDAWRLTAKVEAAAVEALEGKLVEARDRRAEAEAVVAEVKGELEGLRAQLEACARGLLVKAALLERAEALAAAVKLDPTPIDVVREALMAWELAQ